MTEEVIFIIYNFIASASFAYCRIAPIFFLMPFLNSGNIPSVVRHPVIIIVGVVMAPKIYINYTQVEWLFILGREVIVGLFVGCFLAAPFWIFHAIGNFIDNQRGATLSSTLDPATGVDTSELARLFNLFAAVVYLNNGGMLLIMEALWKSYQLCEPFSRGMPDLRLFINFINEIMSRGIIYASPVIVVMLGAEVLLGLISRYASQLNAFAISLTVKSGLAFLILLIYFEPILPEKVMMLSFPVDKINMYFLKR